MSFLQVNRIFFQNYQEPDRVGVKQKFKSPSPKILCDVKLKRSGDKEKVVNSPACVESADV